MKLSIRFLAIILWSFTLTFFITIFALKFPENQILQKFIPEIRRSYQWDFELMFTAIYFVWAVFLWRASYEPEKHRLFIDFSIWTNMIHGIVMIFIGTLREGEFFHLLMDGLILIIPAFLIWLTEKKIKTDQKSVLQ